MFKKKLVKAGLLFATQTALINAGFKAPRKNIPYTKSSLNLMILSVISHCYGILIYIVYFLLFFYSVGTVKETI